MSVFCIIFLRYATFSIIHSAHLSHLKNKTHTHTCTFMYEEDRVVRQDPTAAPPSVALEREGRYSQLSDPVRGRRQSSRPPFEMWGGWRAAVMHTNAGMQFLPSCTLIGERRVEGAQFNFPSQAAGNRNLDVTDPPTPILHPPHLPTLPPPHRHT